MRRERYRTRGTSRCGRRTAAECTWAMSITMGSHLFAGVAPDWELRLASKAVDALSISVVQGP